MQTLTTEVIRNTMPHGTRHSSSKKSVKLPDFLLKYKGENYAQAKS